MSRIQSLKSGLKQKWAVLLESVFGINQSIVDWRSWKSLSEWPCWLGLDNGSLQYSKPLGELGPAGFIMDCRFSGENTKRFTLAKVRSAVPLCSGLKLAESTAEVSPRPFLALVLLIKLFRDSPINCLMTHFQLKEQCDLHVEPKTSSFVYLPKDVGSSSFIVEKGTDGIHGVSVHSVFMTLWCAGSPRPHLF